MENRNTITLNGQAVSVSVSVFLFKEGEVFIAYCPSLDLSGYDTTEDKARADFEYILQEWLQEQVTNGTLQEDLTRYGWKIEHGGATEPTVEEILQRNRSASKVFELPEFRKTNVHAGLYC